MNKTLKTKTKHLILVITLLGNVALILQLIIKLLKCFTTDCHTAWSFVHWALLMLFVVYTIGLICLLSWMCILVFRSNNQSHFLTPVGKVLYWLAGISFFYELALSNFGNLLGKHYFELSFETLLIPAILLLCALYYNHAICLEDDAKLTI